MTTISIRGEAFWIDGAPTHAGRQYDGHKIEGLLFNCRLVQAIFDDENPDTVAQWAYPDTGIWDAERNLNELIAALPQYKAHGCDAITINLQGGMPVTGTERVQPWRNSAIDSDGALKPAYMDRLSRLLKAADEAGIVVIVGYYYFGQDQYMDGEDAIKIGTVNATKWLMQTGLSNILIEINNETDVTHYAYEILLPARIHELIQLAKSSMDSENAIPVSTSFSGGNFHGDIGKGLPTQDALRVSDYALVHTNKWDTRNTKAVVTRIRDIAAYKECPMPIVINEDSTAVANLFAAAEVYAPWGYYDQGDNNYRDGYQSPPVNWGINTAEKKNFFEGVATITGKSTGGA